MGIGSLLLALMVTTADADGSHVVESASVATALKEEPLIPPRVESPRERESLASTVPANVRRAVERRWARALNITQRVALYPVRLVPRLVLPILKGRAMQTLIVNPTRGVYHLVGALQAEDGERQRELLMRAGYDFADPASPLVLGNRIVADVTQALKAPLYAYAKMSSRIQLCAANLMTGVVDPYPDAPFKLPKVAYQMSPLVNALSIGDHVGLLIDDLLYETDDPSPTHRHLTKAKNRGGVVCTSVPMLKDQSESVAIECLRCLDGYFNTPEGHLPYRVDRYNCSAYTKDILHMCGLGFAGSSNFGVGNELGFSYNRERKLALERGRRHCMRQIENQRNLIFATENGEDISSNSFFTSLDATGPDFRLQMITSAARSKNAGSRQWVAEKAKDSDFAQAYLFISSDGLTKLKASGEAFLKDAFEGMDDEGDAWMRAYFPQTAALYERYRSAKKIDSRTQKQL